MLSSTMTILVGTASWADKSLVESGKFYPPDVASPEERLRYYASQFPIVEVDATYYALPAPRMAELWLARTPPDFTFDIKAHALMTGQGTETRRLPEAIREALPEELQAKTRIYAKDFPAELHDEVWRQFRSALAPLEEGATTLRVTASNGKEFDARVRIDTPNEWLYYRHDGILHYVLRDLLAR